MCVCRKSRQKVCDHCYVRISGFGGGGEEGAVVGTHKAHFNHLAEDIDAAGNPLPGGESALPDKYLKDNSDITKEVAEGEQVIDFKLDGK